MIEDDMIGTLWQQIFDFFQTIFNGKGEPTNQQPAPSNSSTMLENERPESIKMNSPKVVNVDECSDDIASHTEVITASHNEIDSLNATTLTDHYGCHTISDEFVSIATKSKWVTPDILDRTLSLYNNYKSSKVVHNRERTNR